MSTSESESSDAPETISLKTAKSESKQQRKATEDRQRAEAQIRNQRNQARDAKLKTAKNKKKRDTEKPASEEVSSADELLAENEDTESLKLHKRMEKAMQDAEEDQDQTESEDDAMQEENEDDIETSSSDSEPNPDYLPEHYFLSASSSKPLLKSKKPEEDKSRRRKRKGGHRKKAEERVIGSRVIRTLQSSIPPATGRTIPSVNARKFLKRQLKGDIKSRGWERRQVAIGSMSSRSGPALRFTRV